MTMLRVGIDLGGSKIELGLMDAHDTIVYRQRCATPKSGYQDTLQAIHGLINDAIQQYRVRQEIGIGIPGSPSPTTGLIRNANSTCLNGHPLQQDLENLLQRPVRLANDANCFALSEARSGAGAGAQSVFGVILGTGAGGGLVYNGDLLVGHNHIGGEWGHNPLPWLTPEEYPGDVCYCGNRGCIETFVSGTALARWHLAEQQDSISGKQICERAMAGDPACQHSLRRYCDRLARALAHVINLYDPECIVLGGGVSQCPLLYEWTTHLWQPYIFSDIIRTRLLPPQHGDASGVRGAAWLWGKAVA